MCVWMGVCICCECWPYLVLYVFTPRMIIIIIISIIIAAVCGHRFSVRVCVCAYVNSSVFVFVFVFFPSPFLTLVFLSSSPLLSFSGGADCQHGVEMLTHGLQSHANRGAAEEIRRTGLECHWLSVQPVQRIGVCVCEWVYVCECSVCVCVWTQIEALLKKYGAQGLSAIGTGFPCHQFNEWMCVCVCVCVCVCLCVNLLCECAFVVCVLCMLSVMGLLQQVQRIGVSVYLCKSWSGSPSSQFNESMAWGVGLICFVSLQFFICFVYWFVCLHESVWSWCHLTFPCNQLNELSASCLVLHCDFSFYFLFDWFECRFV